MAKLSEKTIESGSTLASMMGDDGGDAWVGNHLGVDPAATLEDAEDRHFASSAAAALALTGAAEIAFVDFDLALEGGLVLDLGGVDFTQAMIEERGSVLVDADQFGGDSGRCPGNEMFA